MKELNRIQTAVFLVGALLMVVGAGASVLAWWGAPYVFSLGAVGFASMQMLQRYDGPNFTVRRLRRMMLLSDVLLLLSGVLMFASMDRSALTTGLLRDVFHIDQLTYVQYIYNKWVVTLLIAAILQLYTAHRIGNELEKEG